MNNKIKVNCKLISIVLICIGIIYVIVGAVISSLWQYIIADEWGIVMIVEGLFLFLTAMGLLIKQLLPEKKLIICLLVGYLTAFIGVIIALILNKNKNKTKIDKYESLERLKKLKDDGVITAEEFEAEKSKILE